MTSTNPRVAAGKILNTAWAVLGQEGTAAVEADLPDRGVKTRVKILTEQSPLFVETLREHAETISA